MLSDDKWNELLNGPLYHPALPFTIMRRLRALRFVVDCTGDVGQKTLLDHCHHGLNGNEEQYTLKGLAGVLRAVVEATGEEGENALLDHCRYQQQRDEAM